MLVDATKGAVFAAGWPEGWAAHTDYTHQLPAVQLVFHPGASGALTIAHDLWWATETGSRATGVCSRVQALAEALARYFNAAGSRGELRQLLQPLLDAELWPQLDPPECFLIHTDQEVGPVTHVFVDQRERQVVVWEEGASVELMPLREYDQQLDEALAAVPDEL
jgi:hypothetical protein